jgi:hypothetical protein
MSRVIAKSTGVEELLDEMEIVLIRDINEALAEVYARRQQSDIDRAQRRGVNYVPMEYDEVPTDHFHTGNFPSLVLEEVPPESYPYIVLTIEDYSPDPESAAHDQMNVYRDAISVHCLASATPEEGSEIVFRRAVRLGEAVFLSLMSDGQMSRRLASLSNPVRGQASVPWTYRKEGRGEKHWFQAVGTQFAIKNYTSMFD